MNKTFKKTVSVLMSVLMVMALCAGAVFTAFAVDMTALRDKISYATGYWHNICNDYPDAAATLYSAIGDAEEVYYDPYSSQEEADAATVALDLAVNKAAFEKERADALSTVNRYARSGDSAACAALIAAAREQLTGMEYDESIDLYANRDKLNSVAIELSRALEAQRAADYDASANWVPVAVSPDGLADGSLYLDLDVLEAFWTEMFTWQIIYDIIPANNTYRAGIEYLKGIYPEQWTAAYTEIVERNHLNPDDYDEVYFSAEAFGGPYRYDAEVLFAYALSELGVNMNDWDEVSEYGVAYVETAYSAQLAQARAQAEAQSAARINPLKAAEWYINTNDYTGIKAIAGGEPLDISDYQYNILSRLNEAGAEWVSAGTVESAEGLTDGDYYVLKEDIVGAVRSYYESIYGEGSVSEESVAKEAGSYSFCINKKAADDSMFRYKVTQTYDDFETSDYMPLRQIQYPGPRYKISTEFLDEAVKLYHPSHSFGDWAPDADNADQHIRTCSVCGETEAAAHTWEWVTDTAPTATETGVQHEECAVCGAKRNENTEIAATGDDTPDDTSGSGSSSAGRGPCVWCGEVHNGGFFDTLIFIVHAYMAYFRALAALFGVSV